MSSASWPQTLQQGLQAEFPVHEEAGGFSEPAPALSSGAAGAGGRPPPCHSVSLTSHVSMLEPGPP